MPSDRVFVLRASSFLRHSSFDIRHSKTMRDLVAKLLAALDAGRPAAYCRLVETRGSTPQKAGAAMLVFADGSQFGTLGGGCVEAEVKRRALAILADGAAEIVSFQLDSDYGWDDGLICGGRMQVLVEPLRSRGEAAYYEHLGRLLAEGRGCLEALVFDAEKSGLLAATSYLFDDGGRLAAHRGGRVDAVGDAPAVVREHLPDLAERPRPSAKHGISFLPNLGRCRLVIVGGGHIGQAVGNLAADLDFDVTVVDDRAEYVTAERFPRAVSRLTGDIATILKGLEITPDTYCLIVTRGHNHDEEALFHVVDRGARYVGMIGSRRKIKLIFDDLEAEGVSTEALARVFAPVGIDIGSQTVPEIAVSILAELIAHRNCGGVVPGRPASVAVDSH
jgi:xanthine dehydrogenase accessory factor